MSIDLTIPSELPLRCFVSHAYEDGDAVALLRRVLPPAYVLVIFPPVIAPPDEMVSSHIIPEILACDGLIYIASQASNHSFWVAFERDFARLWGKRVFSFEPHILKLARDEKPVVGREFNAHYAKADAWRVEPVLSFMRTQRYVKIYAHTYGNFSEPSTSVGGSVRVDQWVPGTGSLRDYHVVFWSALASRDDGMARFIREAMSAPLGLTDFGVLFALLDRSPPPEFFGRSIPGDGGLSRQNAVPLYGDGIGPDVHQIDDLIVSMIWHRYRRSPWPFELYT